MVNAKINTLKFRNGNIKFVYLILRRFSDKKEKYKKYKYNK